MMYMGIGNAGCQMAARFRDLLYRIGTESQQTTAQFFFGDADTNNSTISQFARDGAFTQNVDGQGVLLLPLSEFWSGGCGVYHVVGELVARAAQPMVNELITGIGQNTSLTCFFSVGGGTGGGAGVKLAKGLKAEPNGPSLVRMFAILPELDQPMVGGNNPLLISGQDSFQCVSAGRFLTLLMHEYMSGAIQGPFDTFLVSNSYFCSDIAQNTSFSQSVDRLDDYMAAAQLLMPDKYHSLGPDGGNSPGLLSFGLGFSSRFVPGQPAQDNPETTAKALVKSCLQPLDLSQDIATGISTIPTQIAHYRWGIEALIEGEPAAENDDAAQDTKCALGQASRVDVFIYRDATKIDVDLWNQVQDHTRTLLENIFGAHNNTQISAIDINNGDARLQGNTYGLLICIRDSLIEDVYRLIAYYLMSTFEWDVKGDIDQVSSAINQCLINEDLRDEASIRDFMNQHAPLRNDNPEEVYNENFWGNMENLKGRVQHALGFSKDDFNFLDQEHIVSALMYLRKQIWYRSANADNPVNTERNDHL